MEIFNVQIFGEDKNNWLSMPVEDKVEWIRKHTNQVDDFAIEEFVNNPKVSKDKICLTCSISKYEKEKITINEVLINNEDKYIPKQKKSSRN